MSREKYGILIGRLWIRYPKFKARAFWVGVHFKKPYWEGERKFLTFYICFLPMFPTLFSWEVKDE